LDKKKIFEPNIRIMVNKNKIAILVFSLVFLLSTMVYAFAVNRIDPPKTENEYALSKNLSSVVEISNNSKSASTSGQSSSNNFSSSEKIVKEIEVKVVVSSSELPKISEIKEVKPELPLTKVVQNSSYKILEGNQWKEVYEKAKQSYPNTKSEYGGLNYFGDPTVNQVVIDISLQRGFTKRNIVDDESKLVNVEGYLVQKPMADALIQMFADMRANGHNIVFLSGYRGIPDQSSVFGTEFYNQSLYYFGREVSNQEILDRKADQVINKTLNLAALPGYSRHHQGYAVDLTEAGTYYRDFARTGSYEWMSKNNFENTKKYGIIPSYPKGVELQGPEPESWEFVYVGKEFLSN
jgi:LAS superfamily LD-carboxypeptidase LdcB